MNNVPIEWFLGLVAAVMMCSMGRCVYSVGKADGRSEAREKAHDLEMECIRCAGEARRSCDG